MKHEVNGFAVDGLPAVDELTKNHVIFRTHRRRVSYSAAIGQALATAEVERVRPILITGSSAQLSPFLNMELGRLGGSWVVEEDRGTMLDALSGRRLESLDDLGNHELLRSRPPELSRDHTAARPIAQMAVEVLVAHRPTQDLLVGDVPTSVLDALALRDLDAFGQTEPLLERWDRHLLTAAARTQMPVSGAFRGTSPDGAVAVLRYDHNKLALVERLNMLIPLESYDDAAGDFAVRSSEILEDLHERHTIIAATISLLDGDAGGFMTLRRRRPEVPQAILVGPWALRQAAVNPDSISGIPGVRVVGPAWSPAVLAEFESRNGPPWMQFSTAVRSSGLRDAIAAVGFEELMHHGE